ncbi:MAG: hypothetical protein ACSHYB_07000 [Roseibacillus sp.]
MKVSSSKPTALLAIALLIPLLSSCSTSSSNGVSAENIESLAISTPVIEAESYTIPAQVYIPPQTQSSSVPFTPTGGSFAQGFVAGALGQLLRESMNQSDGTNPVVQDFEQWKVDAQKNLPPTFQNQLQKSLTRQLSSQPGLAGKITAESPNIISLKVIEYGYKKTGRKERAILMTPYVVAELSLTSEGKSLIKNRKISAQTFASKLIDTRKEGYELSTYAASQPSAQAHLNTALNKLAEKAKDKVLKKLQ